MPKPTPIAYAPNKIPIYLRERPQWVCWKYELSPKGKWTKVPYQPGSGSKAASTRPAEWSSFTQVVEALDHYNGIGYCLADDEQIVGIDIDHAVSRDADGGFVLDAVAQDIVDAMQSYTELSVSGTGVHVFAFGTKPGDRCRRGAVEMYSKERFLTFTGRRFKSVPATIEARPDQIKTVYQKYLEEPEEFGPRHTAVSAVPHEGHADAEVLDKVRGPWKHQAPFLALYNGGDGSYGSQSEADLALCGMLAFWAGPHPEQIDRLFRTSKLMRPKWDSKRSGSTYGADTIEKAIGGRTDFYSWPTSDNGHARKSELSGTEGWPTPSPLPNALPPVPAFELGLLPAPFKPLGEGYR
jgi:putative DNA primase/helicase